MPDDKAITLAAPARPDGSRAARLVKQLLARALRQLNDLERADRAACAYYIEQALRVHRAGQGEAPCGRHVSGLALWQVRVINEVALARLDAGLAITELATACQLSRGYFTRAFKVTFGESPHKWRHGKRIEHACRQLITSTSALADIAIQCGFTDQAHFTRSFKAATGATPHSYRRTHTQVPIKKPADGVGGFRYLTVKP